MKPEIRELQNNWQQKAACLGVVGVFYPEPSERPQIKVIREAMAKSICDKCIVLNNCRDYVEKNPEYGFWAGMSEEERFSVGLPLPSHSLGSVKRKKIKNI